MTCLVGGVKCALMKWGTHPPLPHVIGSVVSSGSVPHFMRAQYTLEIHTHVATVSTLTVSHECVLVDYLASSQVVQPVMPKSR